MAHPITAIFVAACFALLLMSLGQKEALCKQPEHLPCNIVLYVQIAAEASRVLANVAATNIALFLGTFWKFAMIFIPPDIRVTMVRAALGVENMIKAITPFDEVDLVLLIQLAILFAVYALSARFITWLLSALGQMLRGAEMIGPYICLSTVYAVFTWFVMSTEHHPFAG